jgi:hypothetical protein
MIELLKPYIATILRNLLGPVVVYLAAQGYLTENQSAAFILALATVVLALGSGLFNKYVVNQKLNG